MGERATPTIFVSSGRRFLQNSRKRAGTSFRDVRSPDAPKITMVSEGMTRSFPGRAMKQLPWSHCTMIGTSEAQGPGYIHEMAAPPFELDLRLHGTGARCGRTGFVAAHPGQSSASPGCGSCRPRNRLAVRGHELCP